MIWPFSSGYEIVKGKYGSRMILSGSWTDSIAKVFEKRKVVELELNPAKGWKRSDLSFLQDLTALVAFEIVDGNTKDIRPIHFLSNLKSLKVLTYCDSTIDFSSFPRIERVSLEWRDGAMSLYNCSTLKHVFINSCSAKSLQVFHKLEQLEYLSLKSPQIESIGEVKTFQKLTYLGIFNAKSLLSLEGVGQFPHLETLEIERCRKISNIIPVSALKKLQRLMLANCGEIDSLKPVSTLVELKEVYFHESTNIRDGDLAILKMLPKLEDTSFQERRHYNCKWEDLPMRCSKQELRKVRKILKRSSFSG
jgi:Leucine-rich repeat (LRR) protein